MSKSFRSPAKVMRRLTMAPSAAREVKNWGSFIYHYALGLVPQGTYNFRNGAHLKIGQGIDHAPIIEVFLRREYGPIADGAVIVDLGASIGTFSVYAGTIARKTTIYAYEPLPGFFDLLQENLRLNRLDGTVRSINAAVAGAPGERDLVVTGGKFYFPTLLRREGEAGTRSIRVPCTTLPDIIDAHGLTRIDLLKMDCEGSEYEILYAVSDSYLRRIAEIRLEYHNLDADQCNRQGMAAFLRAKDYEICLTKENTPTNGILWARRK